MSAEYTGCSADVLGNLTALLNSSDAASYLCASFLPLSDADILQTAVQTRFGDFSIELNVLYLLTTGALVFIMHAGFAMLCAGAIRHKNTMNILLQTVLDAAVSALAFYVCGFAFAYGIPTITYDPVLPNVATGKWNGFIGTAEFALSGYTNHANPSAAPTWQDFFFQWAFAATATTIPAGCVAERFNFHAYMGYSIFISAFVYPVVVHWQWSQVGWLGYGNFVGKNLFGSGMIDYAGSSVVHMVGGLSGMMGCILVGPRLGRFDSSGKPVDMPGHSPTLVVLGTVLLWFGWYGFNPGSQILLDGNTAISSASNFGNSVVVSRAAVTTTLAGAAGAVSALMLTFFRHKAWDVISLCNGALVGFVAVTAGANVLEPWAAIIDGMVAAWVFEIVCIIFLKLRIDDPLSAAPMHGFCGMWGVFFVGLLAKPEYVEQAYAGSHEYLVGVQTPAYPAGAFYPGSGGRLIASQCIGILSISAWVCGLMGIFFTIFKLLGWLRISANEEYAGLDVSKHGGSAYAQYPGDNGNQVSLVQIANKDDKRDNIFGGPGAADGPNTNVTPMKADAA